MINRNKTFNEEEFEEARQLAFTLPVNIMKRATLKKGKEDEYGSLASDYLAANSNGIFYVLADNQLLLPRKADMTFGKYIGVKVKK